MGVDHLFCNGFPIRDIAVRVELVNINRLAFNEPILVKRIDRTSGAFIEQQRGRML
jgi:hypothetical protein